MPLPNGQIYACLAGGVAHERIGALRYPSSAADVGVNVVVFADNLAPTGGWYQTTDPVSGDIESWP